MRLDVFSGLWSSLAMETYEPCQELDWYENYSMEFSSVSIWAVWGKVGRSVQYFALIGQLRTCARPPNFCFGQSMAENVANTTRLVLTSWVLLSRWLAKMAPIDICRFSNINMRINGVEIFSFQLHIQPPKTIVGFRLIAAKSASSESDELNFVNSQIPRDLNCQARLEKYPETLDEGGSFSSLYCVWLDLWMLISFQQEDCIADS